MLPLATHCHTHYQLHPLCFVFFKFKNLVAKQHLTTYVQPCKYTHDYQIWCNIVFAQRRWVSGVSVVTTGAIWVRELGKSRRSEPSSNESKCYHRWVGARDGMTVKWWNLIILKFRHEYRLAKEHPPQLLSWFSVQGQSLLKPTFVLLISRNALYMWITWSLARTTEWLPSVAHLCRWLLLTWLHVYFDPWINTSATYAKWLPDVPAEGHPVPAVQYILWLSSSCTGCSYNSEEVGSW